MSGSTEKKRPKMDSIMYIMHFELFLIYNS